MEPDDAFHEIQLNGKQLVFLFMAATVVSVVIFLCGVLVGRGVRAERGAIADVASATGAETMPQQPAPLLRQRLPDPTRLRLRRRRPQMISAIPGGWKSLSRPRRI